MKPGRPLTGCVLVALLAVLAHCGTLGAQGLVWDDAVFLLRDERLHSLAHVFTAFREPYFRPPNDVEMYRPVVNASFALDWFVSGSSPGDPHALWFRVVNLGLHAANAALAYVFLANVTGRSLGAPLIGAALFAVHPLAVEPVGWIVGRCDLLGTAFGLTAGVLLLRSPQNGRLLPLALLAFAVSLFAKANALALPLVVALGVVAYRGLPVRRLLGRRHLPRFAAFALPLAVWWTARRAVLGAPFPRAGGLAWHDVEPLGAALGVGRAFWMLAGNTVLPVSLCGDYAADVAWTADAARIGGTGWAGLALLAASAGAGCAFLRRAPRVGFPLLAFAVTLLPVLQVVRIGAIVADRFAYLPAVFACLLAGEGLERLHVKARSAAVPATFLAALALLGTLSHVRAQAWSDETTFDRDVLARYPGARNATMRLAVALSETGARKDHDEAVRLLEDAVRRTERPWDELGKLSALRIERGELEAAERDLRRLVSGEDGARPSRRVRAHAHHNLAVVLKNTGRRGEAREELRRALELVPELSASRALLESLDESEESR